MKQSLTKIAEEAGCSVSTASRIMSGKAQKYRIGSETTAKVLEIARRQGYTPRNVAHSLRKEKTYTIGLILPSISNPFFAEMASVIISAAYAKGYTAFVMDAMEDGERFHEGLDRMVSRNVDGIIAVPCSNNPIPLENVDFSGTPVILADRFFRQSTLSYVTTNNYIGSSQATSEIIQRGHRKIACIQGALDSTPNIERVRGYREAMEKAGCKDFISIRGNEFSIQNGYLETKVLLDSEEKRPTAIFALSNTICMGAMKAIRESGLRIPEDISLVSFDDYEYMDLMEPAITRVSQPVEDMGKMCAKLLFDRIDSATEEKASTQIRLSPSLILRGSLAAPSHTRSE